MEFYANVKGTGCRSQIKILLDDPEKGEEIGTCDVGTDDGAVSCIVKNVTGRHSVYLVVKDSFGGYFTDMFKGRYLFELLSFVFTK